MTELQGLIARAANCADLDRAEIAQLLAATGDDQQALFDAADRVRANRLGDEVHLRGIIEFSNICRMDCLYCGIRKSNGNVRRYWMEPSVIVDTARRAANLGYRTVVLQAGESNALDPELLAWVIRRIRQSARLVVTLSVGERTRAEYQLWREAGADRYLLRHETSDPTLFARLRPGRTLEQRLQCLEDLRALGYEVGSGFMVGLPGQTLDAIAGDIDLLRDLHVEMAGIGPFIPHPETPLSETEAGTLDLTLKALALTRLCLPEAHLPATTAVGSIHPRGRQLALRCGADVIMPNVTPAAYRENYQLYPNKICLREEPEHCAPCVAGLIAGEGRVVAMGPGYSPRRSEPAAAD
ncbi:MAG TPA: [FeFe] hydrogenase H-cluster radical SAM maturase HydE [Symbiobacteriaceae bacterium]|jgi:biotin synthase